MVIYDFGYRFIDNLVSNSGVVTRFSHLSLFRKGWRTSSEAFVVSSVANHALVGVAAPLCTLGLAAQMFGDDLADYSSGLFAQEHLPRNALDICLCYKLVACLMQRLCDNAIQFCLIGLLFWQRKITLSRVDVLLHYCKNPAKPVCYLSTLSMKTKISHVYQLPTRNVPQC